MGQLPEFVLAKAQTEESQKRDWLVWQLYWPHITYNFAPILKAYKSYKLEQYEKKISRTMTPENIEGKLNRIAMAIEDTKGLSDATGIQKFLARVEEEGVRAPKSKKVVLDILSDFVVDYLVSRYGTQYPRQKIDILQFKTVIKNSQNDLNLPMKRWNQARETITNDQLPTITEANKLSRDLVTFVTETLIADSISELEFIQVQRCLITMLIMKNVSRTSEILKMQKCFLERAFYDERSRLTGFECVPENLRKTPPGAEREAVQLLYEQLQQSHKTFHIYGSKVLVMNKEESDLMAGYLQLLERMGKANWKFMWSQYTITDDSQLSDMTVYKYQNKYYRTVARLFECKKFTSKNYRKLMKSMWADDESITERHRNEMNDHVGHSKQVSKTHYENARKKLTKAKIVSHHVDRALHNAAGTSTSILPPAIDACEPSGSFVAPESLPLLLPLPELESEENHSQVVADNSLSEKQNVLRFLNNRKERPGRQKYTLTQEIREWLAELYVDNMNGKIKSLSRAVEDSPYDLTRDQVCSIFKQITTWENNQ